MKKQTTQSKKIGVFDYVNSIFYSNDRNLWYEDNEGKSYVSYIVTKALSQYMDTALIANEVNQFSKIPSKMEYDFLINITPKRKRYGNWAKSSSIDKNEDTTFIESLMSYYGCSKREAEEYLKVLSKEQIYIMKTTLFEKGGKEGKENGSS